MKNLAMILLSLSGLAGCNGSQNASLSQTNPPPSTGSPPPIKSDYTARSAHDVFASQYSKVELLCSIFAVAHEKVLSTDTPNETLEIPVFPEIQNEILFQVNTPSSNASYKGSIKLELTTLYTTVGGQIDGQTPVVQTDGTLL